MNARNVVQLLSLCSTVLLLAGACPMECPNLQYVTENFELVPFRCPAVGPRSFLDTSFPTCFHGMPVETEQ